MEEEGKHHQKRTRGKAREREDHPQGKDEKRKLKGEHPQGNERRSGSFFRHPTPSTLTSFFPQITLQFVK